MLRVTSLVRFAINDMAGLFMPQTTSKYADIGTIYHLLILRENMLDDSIPEGIEVLQYQDYRTKEAKTAKETAINNGSIPILEHEYKEIKNNIEKCKEVLTSIFGGGLYEQEKKGRINEIDIVGHLDCIKDNTVLDLKVISQNTDLNRLIFDRGYQLQMYLYMYLANLEKANLVFFNKESLYIEVKTLSKDVLNIECEILLSRAYRNIINYDMALFDNKRISFSEYIPPQWALNNLLQIEEALNEARA